MPRLRYTMFAFVGIVTGFENCTWPECTIECQACNPLLNYECSYEQASFNKSCGSVANTSSSNNEAIPGVCTITGSAHADCLCPYGYCGDGEGSCRALVCIPGAHPPPYKAVRLVHFLRHLAAGASIPARNSANGFVNDWFDFLNAAALVPLAFIGITIVTTLCTWCCIAKPKLGVCCLYAPQGALFGLAFLLALITFMVAVTGVVVGFLVFGDFRRNANEFATFVVETLHRILSMTAQLSDLSEKLISLIMYEIPNNCPWPIPPVLAHLLADQRRNIILADTSVKTFNDYVAPNLDILEAFKTIFGRATALCYSQFIPLVSMACLSLHIIVDLLLTRCGMTCIDLERVIFLTLASLCNAIFAIFGVMLLMVTILGSGFCYDVDNQIISFANFGSTEQENRIVDYYLTGNSVNPLRSRIATVSAEIESLGQRLFSDDLRLALHIAKWVCPAFNISLVRQSLEVPVQSSKTLHKILSASYIWPEYRGFVQEGLCSSALTGAGVTALLTCLATVFLWPCLACTVNVYLHRRKHDSKKSYADDADSRDADDDDDDDDEEDDDGDAYTPLR